jgi:hypothetical protein
MSTTTHYTQKERFWLWTIALFGFVFVNGAFIYGMVAQPGSLAAALRNPISLAFLVEATIMLGLLAYLLTKWGVNRMSAGWFVLLSLLGSMAFALPAVILRRNGPDSPP